MRAGARIAAVIAVAMLVLAGCVSRSGEPPRASTSAGSKATVSCLFPRHRHECAIGEKHNAYECSLPLRQRVGPWICGSRSRRSGARHAMARAVARSGLPPVPWHLIHELNRNRGGAKIRRVPPGAHAPVTERAALATARRDGAPEGKITSASLVTMGLPGSQRSLDTPSKVWMFGIAHPSVIPSEGPGPTPHRPPAKRRFAAQFVNATTGKWFEGSSGYDGPHE